MRNEPVQDSERDDRESKIMGLSPGQLAAKIIGAALVVIVFLIAISVASHA